MNKALESIKPERPNIIITEIDSIGFYRKMDTEATVVEMIAGKYVLVEEFFSNGLQVLAELKRNLLLVHKEQTFEGKRQYRNAFREASQRLLLKVEDNKLLVKRAPEFDWLESLYPDVSKFYVSFSDVQSMNSSWQWYKNGIEVQTLGLSIHPYYGTYFPTKFDHLKLFDKWLKQYEGAKTSVINMGLGSGTLSFQLIQNGFKNIIGIDSNKNAIIGVAKESKRLGYEDNISLVHSDLFENCETKVDLIVFQAPWLPARHELEEEIDKATYYEKTLFPRFFEQAVRHLNDNGKVVLIFSNMAEVMDAKNTHPIIEELQKNKRFKKELHLRRDVRASSRRTKRRDAKSREKVELWVLSAI
ncbi:MAG: Protein-N(5)-glutamine methyltransferase PrmC, methylates polypeptide chain release factors RF1 and RF2 [uncultured Sulfurovum sp.]|uniref:Protein-N(5)-glutamine methyltransferase PrmC, methylates polypeptide chain release factors RF1 and RF2 n=1 Tax=uncultured Sulfurovum sp. TaxID=269237 RepID=A0A6S6SEQ9_9BACT|nr:MAG: Protein-N(5)-glutamine methyltransferase PrmC, methylates polypeptide chain release factors RF1 and RF2 [uncultured Sulfurovum sp.]